MPKSSSPFERNPQIFDTTMGWRFINPRLSQMHYPYTMGETAENVAKKWNISRHAQDEFALESQERYEKAFQEKKWDEEIIPVEITIGKETSHFKKDEHPRVTSIEKLASLKPAFIKDGTVTAGNSSGINDGASAMLLAGEDAIKKFNLTPIARVAAMAVAGVEPGLMVVAPVPATIKLLKRAALSGADIDLVELNEAFASQSIACIHDLGLDMESVNVNGGAIALGHPLGCSGVRISTTLLHEMMRRKSKYGLATMCVGVGQGAAVLYEKM